MFFDKLAKYRNVGQRPRKCLFEEFTEVAHFTSKIFKENKLSNVFFHNYRFIYKDFIYLCIVFFGTQPFYLLKPLTRTATSNKENKGRNLTIVGAAPIQCRLHHRL